MVVGFRMQLGIILNKTIPLKPVCEDGEVVTDAFGEHVYPHCLA